MNNILLELLDLDDRQNKASSKPWLKLEEIKTARWVKAKNGRLLPLNSAAWRKLRASVLAQEPLCRMCTARGLIVPATDVDHINGAADNRRESLQPLCHECHSRKTANDMGHNVRMGCDAHGRPLDPGHHWNNPATGVLTSRDATDVEISPATKDAEPTSTLRFNPNCKGVA